MLRRFGGYFSVSATTRAPTNEEKNGVDYSFVSPEVFQQMIDQKLFIEFAQVFGRSWYGTPRQPVDAALARGDRVLVHCAAGLGRTGMLVAKLLVLHGVSAEEAITQVRSARPGTIETEAQADWVRHGELAAFDPA